MTSMPDLGSIHGVVEFLVNLFVIRVVARVATGTLIKLSRGIPSPYCRVFLLEKVVSV